MTCRLGGQAARPFRRVLYDWAASELTCGGRHQGQRATRSERTGLQLVPGLTTTDHSAVQPTQVVMEQASRQTCNAHAIPGIGMEPS